MVRSKRVFIWCALCIGLASSDQETGCLGSSWACTTRTTCPNPQKEIKNGVQILRTCTISKGISGVCCITGGTGGTKCDERCKEYANSVFIKEYNGMTRIYKNKNTCVESESLIYNGKEAKPQEFPHMALIGILWNTTGEPFVEWHCGGSLVSDQYVLSAAHCTKSKSWKARYVRLGEHDHKSREDDDVGKAEAKDYDIVEWLDHPGYGGTGINDITLYKLNETIVFTKFVRPICLNSKPHTHTHVIATGWGLTENFTTSDVLLKVKLTITDCAVSDDYSKRSRMCAADFPNERDTCKYDSGGPLQIPLNDPYCMYLQLGLTSFGPFPCGSSNDPGSYMMVSFYLPWIESIVWP